MQSSNFSNNPQLEGQQRQVSEVGEDSLMSFIDFRKLLSDVIKYWWVFVVSIVIVLAFLKIYHRYKTPVYSTQATIIVDNSSGRMRSAGNIMDGVSLGADLLNIQNQLAILKSRKMISKVVKSMGIDISYYAKGQIMDVELFPAGGTVVIIDSTHAQPLYTKLSFTPIDEKQVLFSVNSKKSLLYDYSKGAPYGFVSELKYEEVIQYGQPVITPWCAFTLVSEKPIPYEMYVIFNDPDLLVDRYHKSVGVVQDKAEGSSVVTLGINGTNKKKNELFLNTLVNTYINDNLEQKNTIASNTIRFIDNQMSQLTDSLNKIGSEISTYRIQNGIQNDLSRRGNQLFDDMQVYEKQIQEEKLKLAYYEYLEDYFGNDTVLYGVIAPAMYDTKSFIITQQLNSIIALNDKRETTISTYSTDKNPFYYKIISQLKVARNTLLKSVENHKDMVRHNIKDCEDKIAEYNSSLMSLPETERRLLGIDRKYSLNNDVYNYLMRKRSEAQIQKASNASDHMVLDEAMTTGIVSPNVQKNQNIGLTLALFLPLLFFVVRQLLDNKVRTTQDISKITNLPVIGEIPNSNKDTNFVVASFPRSYIAEEFRNVRTKIDFMGQGKKPIVIAVSSSVPGDGKTFSALNVASVYAITKKKTALLGFDLRKPGLTKVLGLDGKLGISDYLIGNCTLEDIVVQVEGIDVIGAGTIPPNPSELIQSEQCQKMMDRLKAEYDVIVIDTPPMGLVSDAYQLVRWADTTLFVVRQDYTPKDALKFISSSFAENGVSNVAIMVNDINNKHTRYGYGYGYGRYGYGGYGKYGRYGKYGKYGKQYGYGYGYGDEKE